MRSKHRAAWDPGTPEGRERIKRQSELMAGKTKSGYHLKKEGPGDDIKMRDCLSCGRMFKSWGEGNRVCDECKTSKAWQKHNFSMNQGTIRGGGE